MKQRNIRDLNKLTSTVFIFLLLANTISFWGEIVALSHYLAHYSLNDLAVLIIIEAIAWTIFANIQSRLHTRYGHQDIITFTTLMIGTIAIGTYALIGLKTQWGIGILFVSAHIISNTFRQHALAYLGPIYSQRHRRNTLINLVVITRATSTGLLLLLMLVFGNLSLGVLLSTWLLMLGVQLFYVFWQSPEEKSFSPITYQDEHEDPRLVATKITSWHFSILMGNPLTRWLTVNALTIAFLSSLVLYETAMVLASRLQEPSEYIRFFTLVTIGGVWITLPITFRLLGSLLRQFNAGRLVWIFPFWLNIAFIGLMLVPGFGFAILGEIVRSPLRKNFYNPLERLLYRAMPSSEEEWARRLLIGVIGPFGRLVAGIVLLSTGSIRDNTVLLILGVTVGLIFLLSSRRTGYLYGQTLAGSLQQGSYRLLRQDHGDLTISDQAYIQQMIEKLQTEDHDEKDLLLMAEAISQSEQEIAYDVLCGLWKNSSPTIQTELIALIVDGWPNKCSESENVALIFEALKCDYPPLRRQALLMVSKYPDLDPNYKIARYLIDPDPKVNVIAAWILIKHPLEEVRHAARAQLRWLAKDNNVSTRVTAINALVKSHLNSFGELMVPLDIRPYIQDNATRVREAVLPAASIEQLLEAVRDPSIDVRNIATQQLRLRYFQGTGRLLEHVVEQYRQLDTAAHHLQIEAIMDYWRLLVAQRSVAWIHNHKRAIGNLQEGFEQLNILDAIIETLQHIGYDSLNIIIKQLERDRLDLIEAMIHYLHMGVDKDRISIIMWILRAGESHERYAIAFDALVNMTNLLIATKFAEALQNQRISHLNNQSPLPEIAFGVLLNQSDEWRPMLTLVALSSIPSAQHQRWISAEQINTIIEKGLFSSSDIIREGARLVRRLLDDPNSEDRYQIEASSTIAEGERSLMLSTLERMLFLRNVSFFENLHLEQLRSLARGCEEITALENETIIKQGEVGDSLFIIVEGRVRIQLSQNNNAPAVISSLGPSEVFGEISLLDGGLRTADIITETPVLLLSIHREALNDALEDDPNIAMIMLQAMAQRLRRTTEMMDYHLKERAND